MGLEGRLAEQVGEEEKKEKEEEEDYWGIWRKMAVLSNHVG